VAPAAGLWQNVEIRGGIAEELPVESESVDVVISNGVLNLSSDKLRSFSEIYRLLRPSGRLYLADVVVQRSCLSPRVATSNSGRLESTALCRRRSFTK